MPPDERRSRGGGRRHGTGRCRGDDALAAGDFDTAYAHYDTVHAQFSAFLDDHVTTLIETGDLDTFPRALDVLQRIAGKVSALPPDLQPEPKTVAERDAERSVAGFHRRIDEATETGDLAHAAYLNIQLGELHEEREEREPAESAYRGAVASARHVDAADPELMLAAFSSLIHFLAPSQESIALAAEMGRALIDRDDTYHPMRAAEAAYHWALAELALAEADPTRTDHAIHGIAQPAIAMLDDVCFHDNTQQLQLQIAATLRAAGRGAEADHWQAEAKRYEDWTVITDQQIPGHVHLWDIHPGRDAGTG